MKDKHEASNPGGLPAPGGEPGLAIEMRGVDKWFGETHVLKSIDLSIHRGECLVLCGPSGSGKSTAIRCMNGLETHDAGSIRINGVEMSSESGRTLRRKIGMVFQQFNLFPHLTVMENCTLGLMATLGMRRAAARDRAMQLLLRVRVAEHAERYPAQLSGGQQQRVAIARALAMEPEIMLFDEPTSALDPEMVNEVLEVMTELIATGLTTVCVTHELGFARRVASRIVFIEAGRIAHDSRPAEFFGAAANTRLGDFLGKVLNPHAEEHS